MTKIVTLLRTWAILALLFVALPFNLALTAVALLRSVFVRPVRQVAERPLTIMVSGGKMTKSLQLARSFHHAGHRVVLVETHKYRLTGHRFSRAVDSFHIVPEPGAGNYADELVRIARDEGVDVYVPVCSPAASWFDALAAPVLAPYCEVMHCDAAMVERLDDKFEFARMAEAIDLLVPATQRVTEPHEVTTFDFAQARGPLILKSIPYDPVNRLDLTPLPLESPEATEAFAASKRMSAERPWILQELVAGQEYCTHSTVRDGVVQLHCCCRSSAFQINYEMVDHPQIAAWVERFVGFYGLTGQVSFDFIQTDDGRVYAIECNPRTHSAITMFYDQPDVARAYLESNVPVVLPTPTSRPTYWIYHEVWRLLTDPTRARERLAVIARGKDAIFDWSDPLPFLMVHHVHLPWLLVRNLRQLNPWIRVDFNIGKLVEPGGD